MDFLIDTLMWSGIVFVVLFLALLTTLNKRK
ncbi:hypothetical protein SAMN06296056_1011196 [Priestia filamentosa]|nr:hypothetical protein SAMN06296056_1011196 [Priestia filamentosa]